MYNVNIFIILLIGKKNVMFVFLGEIFKCFIQEYWYLKFYVKICKRFIFHVYVIYFAKKSVKKIRKREMENAFGENMLDLVQSPKYEAVGVDQTHNSVVIDL